MIRNVAALEASPAYTIRVLGGVGEGGTGCISRSLVPPLPHNDVAGGSGQSQGVRQTSSAFQAETWAPTGNAIMVLSQQREPGSFRCQTLIDSIQLILLDTPPHIPGMQNQTGKLILFVFSLRAKNSEVEVLLFPFLCFLPFILFVPDLNGGLQRRVRNLVQEINTKRIRPPSSLLVLS